MSTKLKKIIISSASAVIGSFIGSFIIYKDEKPKPYQLNWTGHNNLDNSMPILPQRSDQLQRLQHGDEFDILIIGGGATGVGCALDAVTRGLKTALVEANDFSSRTSSKSTKLIHGGVRYLEQAVLKLNREQYNLVRENLAERTIILHIAPHLTRMLPIMIPLYSWWKIPYYWIGLKFYDFLGGKKNYKSYYMSKQAAAEAYPLLDDKHLMGAVCYFDGQQDDSRMCLAIAMTAARYGATICNYVEVTKLYKRKNSKGNLVLSGAQIKDILTGKEFSVKAKCIINATGPFIDEIRKMDDPSCKDICSPSSGTHIILPSYYSPKQMGFLIPHTSNGRIIFCLRWQHHTLAGTTDLSCKVTKTPQPTETEILFIIKELQHFLKADIRRNDVLSAWTGIRPLISDSKKPNTQSILRNHIIFVSRTNLVTVAGGKWTTYRVMAMQAINKAIKKCNLKPQINCITEHVKLEGAYNWSPKISIKLVQDFGVEPEVARHLSRAYGDRAFNVIKMAGLTGTKWPVLGNRIHPDFPYIDAEVRYGIREYACTAIDIIARRTRLAFLNSHAAEEVLIRIIDIMSDELNWSAAEKEKQHKMAVDFLAEEMGLNYHNQYGEKRLVSLTKDEINIYTATFNCIDKYNKGYVSISDISKYFKENDNPRVTSELLHHAIEKISTNIKDKIELKEYLEMMAAIKTNLLDELEILNLDQSKEYQFLKKGVSIETSGGGL